MGLSEVRDAKPAWIGMLTTKHFNNVSVTVEVCGHPPHGQVRSR
jgi:hypothetical protein